jgi:hypothetical protein
MSSAAFPSFRCQTPGCSQTLGLLEVLGTASGSNPADQEILFTCATCGSENALWVSEGKIRAGSSGPVTELPSLHVYIDPTYGIDCILQGRLYHMPKRRAVAEG